MILELNDSCKVEGLQREEKSGMCQTAERMCKMTLCHFHLPHKLSFNLPRQGKDAASAQARRYK
jgi:hypothetical protein